jgi:hypothetical protein
VKENRTGVRCCQFVQSREIPITKTRAPELNFSALVGDDGIDSVLIERALRT